VGVIGIVLFGSINSGLALETDVDRLTYLWRRPGWLSFFFCMTIALAVFGLGVVRLDEILADRSEEDVASLDPDLPMGMLAGGGRSSARFGAGGHTFFGKVRMAWRWLMTWIREVLEKWTANQDDKQVAWMLGIGWACLGGGLAGGCLVFAKAT
jgi:hypothetical protein